MRSGYLAIPVAPPTMRGMDKTQAQDVGAGPEQELVQLGVRIPRSLHFALKSAALHQERDGKTPQTQAEIVAEAIRQWLRSNGYGT
jgi:hypothetical protein